MGMLVIWIRFFLLWPGLPPIGDPSSADCVLVQAFGRNSIKDNVVWIIIRFYRALCRYDDTRTVKRLRKSGFKAGDPNRSLAIQTQELVDFFHICAIVQWEIACAFDWQWLLKNKYRVIIVWPTSKKYFNTRFVKSAMIEVMRDRNLKTPIELAHKRQTARAYLIVRRLLKNMLGRADVIIVPQKTDFFDKESVQWWTTRKIFWIPWEFLARGFCLLKRWV